jgi:hypothetical protein
MDAIHPADRSATLQSLCTALAAHPNIAEKLNIAAAFAPALAVSGSTPVGDDTAVIPNGDHFLLFAAEGMIEAFIERDPWFAGYCAVMVNLSDIAAMGGTPLAITDVLWAHPDHPLTPQIWAGLQAASTAYQVPIVGGHTTRYPLERTPLLAASVLGKATHLITSFDARPGDVLLTLTDLRGAWRGEGTLFWNASTGSPPERLRADLAFPAELAAAGLVTAGKDISNGGLPGTLAMLLATSHCGAILDLDLLPRPPGTDLLRWLPAFPSYGYLFSVRPAAAQEILTRSAARGLSAAIVGSVDEHPSLRLRQNGETHELAAIAPVPHRPAWDRRALFPAKAAGT